MKAMNQLKARFILLSTMKKNSFIITNTFPRDLVAHILGLFSLDILYIV